MSILLVDDAIKVRGIIKVIKSIFIKTLYLPV
jgi:hypothetical protein